MIKLASCAVVCAFLIGCEPTPHAAPPQFKIGAHVLVYGRLEGTVTWRHIWKYSRTEYDVLTTTGAIDRVDEVHLKPFHEKSK